VKSGYTYDVGNLFLMNKSRALTTIETYWKELEGPVRMYFAVYEGDSPSAQFNRIHQTYIADSGTGDRWYSSGPISVYLAAGMYYYIAVSWSGRPGRPRYSKTFVELPAPASFGQLVAGANFNWINGLVGFPPVASKVIESRLAGPYDSYYNWMRLTTCPPGPTPTPSPTPTVTPTSTPCSCDSQCSCDGYCSCDPHSCSCNPQTYYHCTCNPQTYYHCVCNPQTYWW
jgi:hypothetical protein